MAQFNIQAQSKSKLTEDMKKPKCLVLPFVCVSRSVYLCKASALKNIYMLYIRVCTVYKLSVLIFNRCFLDNMYSPSLCCPPWSVAWW